MALQLAVLRSAAGNADPQPEIFCLPEQVLWGDFGEAPLDALAQVSTAVMLPLFSNPTVRAAWPDTVAQDLTTQLHKFLSVGAPAAQQPHKLVVLPAMAAPALMLQLCLGHTSAHHQQATTQQ